MAAGVRKKSFSRKLTPKSASACFNLKDDGVAAMIGSFGYFFKTCVRPSTVVAALC
jgi:hypothetical protein